ncbi:MAG: HlyD family efflux transporter periplasmic adaptor subunit [Burkholderiales bacterium]|nr:HlyD family efflux transporter periplasmic adaptor subunit [Burkholderiales bacterium]
MSSTEIERAIEFERTAGASQQFAAGDAEAATWAAFVAARSLDQFYASWLAILCAQIEHVLGALLLTRAEPDNTYVPGAIWPDVTRDMAYLAPTAQRALTERQGVVEHAEAAGAQRGARVAYPVEVAGALHGAVVLDLAPRAERELQRALRLIHWGTAWLVDLFRQREFEQRQAAIDRLALATELVATAVQEKRFRAAALALSNDIARRLSCERVSIGADRGTHCRVLAISHTAMFDAKSSLARRIGEAMDETLDLGTAYVHPAQGDDALTGASHAALAQEAGDTAIVSTPLSAHGQDWGVLLLERKRGDAFDAPAVELVRTLGLLLGPLLDLKRDNERGIPRRAWDGTVALVRALFGPRHPGWKLLATVAVLLLLFLSLADGEHRVAAKTVVEGELQRAAVAPFEGYLAESPVRAGDVVKEGELLARLDQRDLELERTKWEAEREQHLRKYRQALAARDRPNMNVLGAQVNQAEAQLQLINEKLARARISAPFDGVVVSGDLSQLLGTPVEQGKILFEIAPLDAYRVILKLDERDIAHVAVGQKGELALSGIPGARLPFSVARITPVSSAEEGRNYFRVEASMAAGSERLRPGMEGVGKVSIGERRLIWIWTHHLVDWLRLAFWTWMP